MKDQNNKLSSFFNSVWFRCISVLLVLTVVLSSTLAIFNDVLYVSASERTDRALKKIYGVIPNYTTLLDVDSLEDGINKTVINYNLDADADFEGAINKIYVIGDQNGEHDELFQSVGFEGYKGGSITLWVRVKYLSNGNKKIEQVLLQEYDKQTLMSKLNSAFYNRFLVDVTNAYKDGNLFTTASGKGQFSNPVSGATYSANAGNNAVNCVVAYVGGVQ